MAGFKFNQMGKYLKDFGLYFRRKKPKRTEEDESTEDEKAFAGDARDETPGDIQMHSGSHKPVYGIRRKIIGGMMIAFVVAFAGGYLFMNGGEKTDKKPSMKTTASEVSQPSLQGKEDASKQGDVSYKDLKTLENQNKAQETARKDAQNQMASRNPSTHTAADGARQMPGAGTDPSVQQVRRMMSANFSAPSPSIPTGSVRSSGASTSPAASAQNQEAQSMEKRYSSAIEFALGRSGLASTESAAVSNAKSSPNVLMTSAGFGSAAPHVNANDVQAAKSSSSSEDMFAIQAGTMIPAMLFTGINTDTPGQVLAQVSADVYDSLTHTNLLIPAGARLLGDYTGSANANGRVAVTFTTLILPSGQAYDIGSSMVATDGGGYQGLVGKVHRHTAQTMSAGMLSSAFAALSSFAAGDSSSQNSFTGGQLAMQGAMANLINSTSSMLSRAADAKATVTVSPGHTFTIYVKQPVSFGSLML